MSEAEGAPYDLALLQADIAQVQHHDAGFGSGRLVADNLILTAAHVLWGTEEGAPKLDGWKVRLARDRTPEIWPFRVGKKVVWHDGRRDLALIHLLDSLGNSLCPPVSPMMRLRVATVDRSNSHYVEARGYPRASKEEGQRYRELTPAMGRLIAADRLRPLIFGVDECDLPNDPRAGWLGMSGSAVLLRHSPNPEEIWAYGVVQEVPANFSRQLRVARLADCWNEPSVRRILVAAGAPDQDAQDPTAAPYKIALGRARRDINAVELEIARKLLSFLEDRRVLFSQIWGIKGISSKGTIISVQQIRERLGSYIEMVDRKSHLSKSLRIMRNACRDFLDSWQIITEGHGAGNGLISSGETDPLVSQFRKVFATELLRIGEQFGFVLASGDTDISAASSSEWKDFYEHRLFMEGRGRIRLSDAP
jgi:hypothetical protein